MLTRTEILNIFSDIMSDQPGICGLITEKYGSDYLFDRLSTINDSGLSKVQFDQLLNLQQIKGVSDGFFKFYWLSCPDHFYNILTLKGFDNSYKGSALIQSIEQLKWGMLRVFIDCLYAFGNIEEGYKKISGMTEEELLDFFKVFSFKTEIIKSRGNTLHFCEINKEDRYLISEMVCKNFVAENDKEKLKNFLINSYKIAKSQGIKSPKLKDLLSGKYSDDNVQLSIFDTSNEYDYDIKSEKDLISKAEDLTNRVFNAHTAAVKNTELYLSLCGDLDVYVATSMRTKDDFMQMANFCEKIFKSEELKPYDLRYFDPTMSAADSHEDKGLIECLMVKSSRMLIYSAGAKESYGKDAEAAMALSLGKPTIFYCEKENKGGRAAFYRDIHPLSRLVNFKTGVACGIIVCESVNEVKTIIKRLLTNDMRYTLRQKTNSNGYYLLEEDSTGSVVRVQTNNDLLKNIFWNNYLSN